MAEDREEDCKTITHIAGIPIVIGSKSGPGSRTIQRCAVCGAKLCDSEGASVPLNKDGTVPEFPTWKVNHLVRVAVGNPTALWILPENEQNGDLPKDSCLDLA